MASFRYVLWKVFVLPSRVALRKIFAFLLMPFLVLFRVPLAVFCLFWRPFQISCAFISALRLLLLIFFGCSVSFCPAYFHSNPLSTRPVPIVLVKCWKVAHWNAQKLLKNCQKSKKLLPKFKKLLPKFLAIFYINVN